MIEKKKTEHATLTPLQKYWIVIQNKVPFWLKIFQV